MSSDERPWRPMSEAPQRTYPIEHVEVLDAAGQIHPEAHFAEDLSGEEQPPFSGWFESVRDSQGRVLFFREIEKPQGWRPQLHKPHAH